PELAPESRDAGFGAVPAQPEAGQSVDDYQAALAEAVLAPAPGYFSAQLSDRAGLAGIRRAAGRFAAEQAELGLTEACLADDLQPERIATSPRRHEPVKEAAFAQVLETVEEIARVWLQFGLTACVHNRVGSFIESEEEVDWVLASTSVSFCPHTGHLAWAGAEPLTVVSRHADRVRSIHFKDVDLAVVEAGEAGA